MTLYFFFHLKKKKKEKRKNQKVITIIDRLGETVKSIRFGFNLQNQQCYIYNKPLRRQIVIYTFTFTYFNIICHSNHYEIYSDITKLAAKKRKSIGNSWLAYLILRI